MMFRWRNLGNRKCRRKARCFEQEAKTNRVSSEWTWALAAESGEGNRHIQKLEKET
jgi:hypothetical protein